MIKTARSLMILILLLFCSTSLINAESTPGLHVSYDQKEDLLTIDAKGVPLTQILARIAEQSGIEILIDPSVEKEINLYLPAQPLEKALKQLARGLNYAMHYDKTDSRLIAMKIVPLGKQPGGKLVSVYEPTSRMSRPDVSGDSIGETSDGSSSRIDTSGYSSKSNPESKSPFVNQQDTVSADEMEAKGLNFKPSKRQNSSPLEQRNNENQKDNSDMDYTNGDNISGGSPDN